MEENCGMDENCVRKQVTWLVVSAVRSKSFGLVIERHHSHYNAHPIYGYCSIYVCVVRPVLYYIVKCDCLTTVVTDLKLGYTFTM